jgi:hypothetical protein
MEEALNEQVLSGEDTVPTILVDQAEFGVNSALQFSHRCFDAWVEDALLDGSAFGRSEVYRGLAAVSSRHHAAPLLERFPVGLVLGCWASRRSARDDANRACASSEIIAVDAEVGERPGSRIDRHHVSNAVKVYESARPDERRGWVRECPAAAGCAWRDLDGVRAAAIGTEPAGVARVAVPSVWRDVGASRA